MSTNGSPSTIQPTHPGFSAEPATSCTSCNVSRSPDMFGTDVDSTPSPGGTFTEDIIPNTLTPNPYPPFNSTEMMCSPRAAPRSHRYPVTPPIHQKLSPPMLQKLALMLPKSTLQMLTGYLTWARIQRQRYPRRFPFWTPWSLLISPTATGPSLTSIAVVGTCGWWLSQCLSSGPTWILLSITLQGLTCLPSRKYTF